MRWLFVKGCAVYFNVFIALRAIAAVAAAARSAWACGEIGLPAANCHIVLCGDRLFHLVLGDACVCECDGESLKGKWKSLRAHFPYGRIFPTGARSDSGAPLYP